jgi:hypothetical protein
MFKNFCKRRKDKKTILAGVLKRLKEDCEQWHELLDIPNEYAFVYAKRGSPTIAIVPRSFSLHSVYE